VFKPGDDYRIAMDAGVRQTAVARMAEATQALLQERLLSLKPILEQHFQVPLQSCEPLQWLVYQTGDFFTPHYDRAGETAPAAMDYLTRRQVAVVLFLTRQTDQEGSATHCGGTLRFYDYRAYGVPDLDARQLHVTLSPYVVEEVRGETGMLVAFHTDMLHEVERVTAGERYTVVSWFF
jgi:predicted 2-oxoglutarate/Fe(II)-dependent dioxygenase YbiX